MRCRRCMGWRLVEAAENLNIPRNTVVLYSCVDSRYSSNNSNCDNHFNQKDRSSFELVS